MSTYWKIFRLANYLQLCYAITMLGLIAFTIQNFIDNLNIGFAIVFCLHFIILSTNNCMNLHFMHQYFPDKPIPVVKKRFLWLLLTLYIIAGTGLLLLFIFGLNEELSADDYTHRNTSAWFFLASLALNFILTIITISGQWKLPRLLTRNNNLSMQQLVDDIGKET